MILIFKCLNVLLHDPDDDIIDSLVEFGEAVFAAMLTIKLHICGFVFAS